MKPRLLKFDIRSFWHAGSGRGGGLALNNMVFKDPNRLPCLPGRSVKGLVRDAMFRAETWGHIEKGRTDQIFGLNTPGPEQGQKWSRHDGQPGCLTFGNAELPQNLIDYLLQKKAEVLEQQISGFYCGIQATAINEHGTAQEKSLRAYEVCIPLELYAPIQALDDRFQESWLEDLRLCLPLIRGLGMGRNRGLGRCQVSLEESA